MWRRSSRSSDSGPPPRRLPSRGQWRRGEERLPLQRRDRPGLAPGSLTALLVSVRAYHRTVSDTAPRSHAGLRPSGVRHRIFRLWLPVVAWAALIFALSSIPDLGTGLGGWDLVLRKLAHAAEYAVLGALLLRATGRARLAFALGTLYAVSDELHQTFVPGRMGSPIDVAIDVAGVMCGIVLWQRLRGRSVA